MFFDDNTPREELYRQMRGVAGELIKLGLSIGVRDSKTQEYLLAPTGDLEVYSSFIEQIYDDVVNDIRSYESITRLDTVFILPNGNIKALIPLTPTQRTPVIVQ